MQGEIPPSRTTPRLTPAGVTRAAAAGTTAAADILASDIRDTILTTDIATPTHTTITNTAMARLIGVVVAGTPPAAAAGVAKTLKSPRFFPSLGARAFSFLYDKCVPRLRDHG